MTRVEVPAELRARLQAKGQAHVLKVSALRVCLTLICTKLTLVLQFYDEGKLSNEQTTSLINQVRFSSRFPRNMWL